MPEKRRKFDAEFREGAVRLVRQRRGEKRPGRQPPRTRWTASARTRRVRNPLDRSVDRDDADVDAEHQQVVRHEPTRRTTLMPQSRVMTEP